MAKGTGCGECRIYSGGPYVLGAGTSAPITMQEATRAYHAASIYMDKQVEVIVNALNASSASDNTIIIFLGDHGQYTFKQ